MEASLWIVALGAAVAGFVQGLSGFAFGMVAMSFWAWGLDTRTAAVLTVFGALTGQMIAGLSMRRAVRLSGLLPLLAGGLAGIPLGVAILPYLDARLFKLGVGTMLAVWCPIMLLSRHLPTLAPSPRAAVAADAAVGLAGGVMGGLGGFTGVVPALWYSLRPLDKDGRRAAIQTFNLVTLGATMAAYTASGTVTAEMLPLFAVVAPSMLLPILLGGRVYIGISEADFRRIVLALLTASGIAMLAAALPSVLPPSAS
ncbi:sulfite exporter TauE/SafE family protein [Azospirillum tabaci]|uniref:sulfite exporter TauE/SafE family protein n=1 Tax=Azospirillum tabaci TaxID=2752310 RepID=UPI001660AA99|nr:sulfite exporter TauE/SafE family protein [Azospirillum tabaci]